MRELLGLKLLQLDALLLKYRVDDDLHLPEDPYLSDIWSIQSPKDNVLPETTIDYDPTMVPPWIFDRGFIEASLLKWEVGYSWQGLVIPIRDENFRLVGSVTRRPKGFTPKYLYQTGTKVSKILYGVYNINRKSQFICVTEGTLDTIWLDQHGYDSVALLGANMSNRQEEILLSLGAPEIVLCLDGDTPGQLAAAKIATRLSKSCMVSFIRLPEEYKDVQEIRDSKILHGVLTKRSIVQWT